MIKKSISIVLVLIAIVSCKKDEENFTLDSDLITNILKFANPDVPDIHMTWRGAYMTESTSIEVLATGEKKQVSINHYNITNRQIGFAKANMYNNFDGDEFVDWSIINNDEIKIESNAFFFGVAPTYFDVEITSDLKYPIGPINLGISKSVVLGALQIPPGLSLNFGSDLDLYLSLYPRGEVQFLRLTMDYSFLSSDKKERSRVLREYHFIRANPVGEAGVTFVPRDEYK